MIEGVRVLVVDDSAVVRRWIIRALEVDPTLHVVGSASNGAEGLEQVAMLAPDVITLDVEMPELDGVEMLRRLMRERPTPVVMVSSKTTRGAGVTLDALALGAVDFVTKPSADPEDQARVASELRVRVLAASTVARSRLGPDAPDPVVMDATDKASQLKRTTAGPTADRIVVLCSSTGGPSALRALLPVLPATLPAAVIVVQHMPAGFTGSLAKRLDGLSGLTVREAVDGESLTVDLVVVAPGDRHLIVSAGGALRLTSLPRVNGVRPSADVTLQSLARGWGEHVLAVVMTGIGVDGREGARAVKAAGGRVICQDAASSLVDGMPRAVSDAGLADAVLPLDQLAPAITSWCELA